MIDDFNEKMCKTCAKNVIRTWEDTAMAFWIIQHLGLGFEPEGLDCCILPACTRHSMQIMQLKRNVVKQELLRNKYKQFSTDDKLLHSKVKIKVLEEWKPGSCERNMLKL